MEVGRRVRAKRSVESAEDNDTNAVAMVVANTIVIDAERKYAEGEGYMGLEDEPGALKFGAGARVKVGAERIRAKRHTVSGEAKYRNLSAIAVANATDIDAEISYSEGEGYVYLEAKPGTLKFGAGARAKVGAQRVIARQRIISSEANGQNTSALVMANTTVMHAERSYVEAEGYMHLKVKPETLKLAAGARAQVSAGGVSTNSGAHMHVKVKPGNGLEANAKVSAVQVRVTEDDLSAEVNGPNASAMISANDKEARVMVGAEIASASLSAGPVGMKVGLGVDTGVRVGQDGAEIKILGCGASFGRTMGVSLFGSELKFNLW